MVFPNYFADAESSFNDADFVIFGVPYDKTSSFRHGADQAPMEIRQAGWNFETYNLKTGVDLRDIKFHDYGDLDVRNDKPEFMIKKVKDFTSNLLKKNKFPIAIGGEHSITPGIVQAFPKNVAVLSLDAHIDFRQQYENEPYNHACVIRRIADHINIENIAVLGIRSVEKEEFEEAKNRKLFYIDSFFIKENGIKKAITDTKKHLKNKKIYLTLDIDVLDPAYAPGTSTPEPFGITPHDVIECINSFSPQLIGFDIVEVCPPFDKGETALLAAKLIRHVIDRTWTNHKA
ncbi:MAG: agmatinase [Candidatus Thermoplasmatota archaeon]|jgi:agmatinase|nr:agmatinase [Candidatus Thermoplasmatota archaeon]